jgi:flagellar biogenesis protein FliO
VKKIGASGPADPSPVGFVVWTFAVLGVMVGAAVLLRRVLGGSKLLAPGGPIAILARRSVGPRQDLLLVRVAGRVLLIGVTKDRLTALGAFDDADDRPASNGTRQEAIGSTEPERELRQALSV